jgi:hypothetical protein
VSESRGRIDRRHHATAAWFAQRFADLGDPAVYTVTVAASAVLAYVTDRSEDDYLVWLPSSARPVRLAPMPLGVAA